MVGHVCPHPNCGKTLSRADRLASHMKVHLTEEQLVCGIDGCTLSYTNARNLRRHQENKHNETNGPKIPDIFTCPFDGCTSAFSHEQSYKRHVRNVHEQSPKFILV